MDVSCKTAAAAAAGAVAHSSSVGMNGSSTVNIALQQLISYASMPQHGWRTVFTAPDC